MTTEKDVNNILKALREAVQAEIARWASEEGRDYSHEAWDALRVEMKVGLIDEEYTP